MTELNLAKIKKLAAAKKYKEIDKLIAEALKGDLTDKEKGAIYTFLSSVYLDTLLHFNNRYERALDEAFIRLREIKKRSDEIDEMTHAASIKNKIAWL